MPDGAQLPNLGPLPCDNFPEDDAEAPDVRLLAALLAPQNLPEVHRAQGRKCSIAN